MKNKILQIFMLSAIVVTMMFGYTPMKAQIQFQNTYTPQELVEDLLLGGGVTISNFSATWNNNTTNPSLGAFTNGSDADLEIDEGILLTTGTIWNAEPDNETPYTSTDFNGQGDPDLTTIVRDRSGFPYLNTYDATAVEFDFVPIFSSVSFDYIFASEEYSEYVCSEFNDAFGFFLSGPGITGSYSNNSINVALVPGTSTHVSINTVNDGCENPAPPYDDEYCAYYNSDCTSSSTYSQYFNDNPVEAPILNMTAIQMFSQYH